MCEQTEIAYLDGEVVWVKLGSCWWPGEVIGPEKLPPDVLPSFRKPPIAIVKFFEEDTYEYVKNINSIYKYNCSKKNDFIKKGVDMYRAKRPNMEKFPQDIIRAETVTGGDEDILSREEFQETKKESYAGIFGDQSKKTAAFAKKGRGRPAESPKIGTPFRKLNLKSDYKVHILVQGSKTPSQPTEKPCSPSTSRAGSESADEKKEQVSTPKPSTPMVATPTISSSGIYACHACNFSTTRLNVLILHNKSHSVTFPSYTPTPIRKKSTTKTSPKTTPSSSKTPKARRPRKEKIETPKKEKGTKRSAADKGNNAEVKKTKTDEEIKSSLLADWDDGDDDESSTNVMRSSPEVPIAAESPAVPTPAELPSAQVPEDTSFESKSNCESDKKTADVADDKPEQTSDSKYDFCEDEDWHVETDVGRKIPRVKNPSARKEETKSLSIDDEEVARDVAELLDKTTMPELPSVPEPLKAEENFPEPPVVKSPDKLPKSPENKSTEKSETQPSKAIFKTKTFFRSRHSRSQDAIGKYVAEQLNAAERMDISDIDLNGPEVTSSPEARDSPPVEPVKVARLAPKIQLKRMKAEAAQLRDKNKFDPFQIDKFDIKANDNSDTPKTPEKIEDTSVANKLSLDVLYPTQEIKPINKASPQKSSPKQDKLKVYTRHEKEKLQEVDTQSKRKDDLRMTKSVIDIANETIEQVSLQKSDEKTEKSNEYLSESTASAVDALLSVSRDADRVTGVISNDLPEDLFEDDHKEIGANNNVNGFNDSTSKDFPINIEHEVAQENENPDNLQETHISENLRETPISDNLHEIQISENLKEKQISVSSQDKQTTGHIQENLDEKQDSNSYDNLIVSTEEVSEEVVLNDNVETIDENVPSESDLQIAEALINMPAATMISQPSVEHQDLPDQDGVPEPIETDGVHEETICTTEHMEVDTEQVETETNKDYEMKEDNVPLEPQNNEPTNDNVNMRFETEHEKSENLYAAQSLVEMSELIDHQINMIESNKVNENNLVNINLKENSDTNNEVETNVTVLPSDNGPNVQSTNDNKPRLPDKGASKLLKILEQPSIPPKSNIVPSKNVIIPGKQKILNFDVAKDSIVSKAPAKQKIIIRRAGSAKSFGNNLMDVSSDKVIISQNIVVKSSPSVSTHSIQSSPGITNDANSIIIQQKVRKIAKAPQKVKHHNSLIAPLTEAKILNKTPATDDAMFDINSMPIVLSEDILTPESIEKMPIVMTDASVVSTPNNAPKPPPKLVKSKQIIERNDKIAISAKPNKPELKTLLINPNNDGNIVTTPNILSKSSKLRGAKPMLVFDKTTGKQKIIMTKPEMPIKELKQVTPPVNMAPQTSPQNPAKTDKFIILPTSNAPRTGRTQKIVIDPNTGKAHVLVAKGSEAPLTVADNKPVSAKLMPPSSDSSPGNTVMIITNAQGAQSRIVLTPEHEKILFPNKQQPNTSQLKTIVHKISTNSGIVKKSVVNSITPAKTQAVITPQKPQTIATTIRAQTKIVPKQKPTTIAKNSAIITSKGQLIVSGRTATTTQNIAPMPEVRTAPKRIVATEPKKLMQAIQKNSSEPLIFLQKNSGAVMQLTQAQFEHLQRTGQIVQRPAAPAQAPAPSHDNKIVVQKSITIPAKETILTKQRVRKATPATHTPIKRTKKEIILTPTPSAPLPPLMPLSNNAHTAVVSSVASTISSTYGEFENFEELLPSTAIVKSAEPTPPLVAPPVPLAPAPVATPPAPAPVADGQLLAIPGEHFGGPSGSFYLCVEDNGTLTPIDNRPLILENNQLVPMPEPLPVLAQPERRDILEAALANSDVFHADPPQNEAPDFRDLNANVSVHCRVSETSTTLNQPIMTPVEVPSKVDSEPAVPSTIEDGLAVIGVTPHTVPTSLELPITVTDPRIAPKTTDPLSNNNYGTTLLPSPSTEMTFVTTEECVVGPISMPLLTDDDGTGKSMPILSDDLGDRAVSSVESGVGSPSSLEEGSWARRLLTPGSDCSDTSAEIPLQPPIQISVNELSRDT